MDLYVALKYAANYAAMYKIEVFYETGNIF